MKGARGRGEFEAVAHGDLDSVQFFVGELEDTMTGKAVEVLVMLVTEDMLVTRLPSVERVTPHQAAFHQEIQRPVNGGFGNKFPGPARGQVKLFRIEMLVCLEDQPKDDPPFGSQLQPLFPEEASKNFILLGHLQELLCRARWGG